MNGNRDRRIGIAIPVRNEARRLPRLLDALARQLPDRAKPLVCFLLDSCSDDSEALLLRRGPSLPFDLTLASRAYGEAPNAGRARRAAMQLCLERMQAGPAYLLTTDADSIPEPDWIRTSCAALDQVDLVAGHISRNRRLPGCWRTRLEDYLDALHRFRRTLDPIAYDPLPSHGSLGGASLGFRSEVYQSLGGFPAFVAGEDRAIVAHARREGYRVRHDRTVRVLTSGRISGRAPGGLADELREQLSAKAPPLVADPRVLMEHYQKQALLRSAYGKGTPALLCAARQLDLCQSHVMEVAADMRSSDAFVETIAPDDCLSRANVLPLSVAEETLARLRQPTHWAEVA